MVSDLRRIGRPVHHPGKPRTPQANNDRIPIRTRLLGHGPSRPRRGGLDSQPPSKPRQTHNPRRRGHAPPTRPGNPRPTNLLGITVTVAARKQHHRLLPPTHTSATTKPDHHYQKPLRATWVTELTGLWSHLTAPCGAILTVFLAALSPQSKAYLLLPRRVLPGYWLDVGRLLSSPVRR